ncbi:MAG: hypothetical protein ABIK76_04245 [candidate division WOR-3 bacterium]
MLGISVSNFYAYIACGEMGIKVINVSDPINPYEIGYYNTPGFSNDIFVVEPYIYTADGYSGFQIYQFYGTPNIEEKNYSFFNKKEDFKNTLLFNKIGRKIRNLKKINVDYYFLKNRKVLLLK